MDRARTQPGIDHEMLWGSMRRLLDRLASAVDRDTFLDESLDAIVEVLGADRGLILLTHPEGATTVVHARAPGRTLAPEEREEISRAILAEVWRTGQPVFWEPTGGNSSASIVSLGIVTAMAAPLGPLGVAGRAAGERSRGVLYVDFRNRRLVLDERHEEFFQAASVLVAMVLEQEERLGVTRQQLLDSRGASAPTTAIVSLDELLAPRSMAAVRREVETSLSLDAPLMLLGESGTGKTLVASAIAEASGRRPVVRAMLGASDDLNTIASELFGHERGAFSGAVGRRTGLAEYAHGGTLILDEVLNLPPAAQQLLLDFAQFGTYRPLGYDRAEPRRAAARIIAVTNGDLDGAMRSGRFRQDLYYRLAGSVVTLPPLRARREDIPSLAEAYLRRIDRGRSWRLAVPVRRLLVSESLAWPGNVRQLESALQRARARALARDRNGDVLTVEDVESRDLGAETLAVPAPSEVRGEEPPLCAAFQIERRELGDSWARLQRERRQLEQLEADVIRFTLERCGGVVAAAARELGLQRTGLLSRMETLGIERPAR